MLKTLVEKLISTKHSVVIGYRNESDEELAESLKDRYIHIKFPNTQGETELGISIDPNLSNIDEFLDHPDQGTLHIAGRTVLDSQPILCSVQINKKTREGIADVQLDTFHSTKGASHDERRK
jgi:hypothetical protein